MLVVRRKPEESILIGNEITIKLLGWSYNDSGSKVAARIGIDAPPSMRIDREEVRVRRLHEGTSSPPPASQAPTCADCGSRLLERVRRVQGEERVVALCPSCEAPTTNLNAHEEAFGGYFCNYVLATALCSFDTSAQPVQIDDVLVRWNDEFVLFRLKVPTNNAWVQLVRPVEVVKRREQPNGLNITRADHPLISLHFEQSEHERIRWVFQRWQYYCEVRELVNKIKGMGVPSATTKTT